MINQTLKKKEQPVKAAPAPEKKFVRGISEIFTSFEWRHAHKMATEIASPPVPPPRDVDLTTGSQTSQRA